VRIGVDLGGTKTEAVVLDADDSIRARIRRPTPVGRGYDSILDNVAAMVQELEAEHGTGSRIGIGTPGSLSPRTGRLKNSNTACLNGRAVKTDLEARLNREIRIANDANCFALSEAMDGAGRGHRVVFGIIMGTGVGGGVVIDHQVWDGRNGIAGEWGHNVLDPDGPPCYCGKQGCIETLLSGPGLVRDYAPRGGESAMDAKAIVARAEQGNSRAIAAMDRFIARFGRALSMVVNILDPDIIILGGGLSNIERLYTDGRNHLAKAVFNDEFTTPLVRNVHGDSAGVLGAAWLWPADQ
jgi:fructokinase